jgi:outer membrane protein assembly factor BamE (lipoprotein component of BamABCDE complex)
MIRSAASLTAIVALLASTAACAPVREQHGWIPDSQSQIEIKPGVDTKSTVLARMGTPSTSGFLESNDWYYITTLQESFAFYKPKTSARSITVVRFASDDVVSKVDKYGLERGRVVAYDDNKTPTRGRELGILEQLLGNVGNKPSLPIDDENGQRQGPGN